MTTLAYGRAEERVDRPLPAAPLDLGPILGTWHNCDRGDSGGILRLDLAERDGALLLRVLGAGSPDPHDWGEVRAQPYAESVTGSAAWAFNAHYDLGFADVVLAAYTKLYDRGGILAVTAYTTFSDGGGRADYWTREFFYRGEGR